MWIGVLSDSCGVVPPRVIDLFEGLDFILHCGNIGDPKVLDTLSQLAPISGVLGPLDTAENYPFEVQLFRKWFDIGVYVTHKIGHPTRPVRGVRERLDQLKPEVVLFGRSEGAFNSRIDDRLYFNPGPSGKKRTKYRPSVGILELEGRIVRGEVVPLDER